MDIYLVRTYCGPNSNLDICHKAVDKMGKHTCPHGVSGAQGRPTTKKEWVRCDHRHWRETWEEGGDVCVVNAGSIQRVQRKSPKSRDV